MENFTGRSFVLNIKDQFPQFSTIFLDASGKGELASVLAGKPGCATQVKTGNINAELFTTRKEQSGPRGMAEADRGSVYFDGHFYECGTGLPHSC
jgi:hypothetical protein